MFWITNISQANLVLATCLCISMELEVWSLSWHKHGKLITNLAFYEIQKNNCPVVLQRDKYLTAARYTDFLESLLIVWQVGGEHKVQLVWNFWTSVFTQI